jgi:hypothetical protein
MFAGRLDKPSYESAEGELAMGTRIRQLAALACVVFAFGAASAASASASSFTASSTGTLKGHAVTNQVFKDNSGTFTCTGTSISGTATELVSQTMKLVVQYSGCSWFGFSSTASPAEYLLHANGEVDLLKSYSFVMNGAGCQVTVLAQKGIRAISFENRSGKLLVTNALSGGGYSSSGGLCGSSGKNLTQTGNYEVELEGGTLTFNP